MRRTIYVVSILMILVSLLGITSAISTNIKDSYSPGETIVTGIFGNILNSIVPNSVELERKGHINIPIDFEVKKLGENYYLWFIAPELPDNYTLIIKDITTTISGKVQEIDYEKNFSVSGNLTDYSVKPGFVSTNRSFQVEVQLNEDNNKQIDSMFLEKTNFTLKPGENTLGFSISEINKSGLFNLSVGKYTLPVYVQVDKKVIISEENETEINDSVNLTETENLTPEEKEGRSKTCSEYPGKICTADETCSGKLEITLDGQCCTYGDCLSKTSSGGSSSWIGYLIAAIVIIAGIFIWIKYKKIKTEKNPIGKVLSSERKTP